MTSIKVRDRRYRANNPTTPAHTLEDLSTDTDRHVRIGVAANHNTEPEILVTLAADTDPRVRQNVAYNANTPPDILTTLATDTVDGVRRRVAHNPNTPPHALATLVSDIGSVRLHLSDNPNTSPAILDVLAADDSPKLRACVARNPHTPTTTVHDLTTDPVPEVAHAATTTGRANCLHRYANTLPEPDRSHALLLVEAGFPGWPDQLATVLDTQRTITITGSISLRDPAAVTIHT